LEHSRSSSARLAAFAAIMTVSISPRPWQQRRRCGGGGRVQGDPANLSPVSGATSYNLYRGTAPGGEGTTPFANDPFDVSLGYTDTGRTNGTHYYYRIAAVSSTGSRPSPSEASAVPDRHSAGRAGDNASTG